MIFTKMKSKKHKKLKIPKFYTKKRLNNKILQKVNIKTSTETILPELT
jgi:hypothetical protein